MLSRYPALPKKSAQPLGASKRASSENNAAAPRPSGFVYTLLPMRTSQLGTSSPFGDRRQSAR